LPPVLLQLHEDFPIQIVETDSHSKFPFPMEFSTQPPRE